MFSPPFYYMPMPVNADGNGPATGGDVARIIHEVWDDACLTVCTCTDERTARHVAALLCSSPIVAPQQCGDWIDDFESGNAAYAASFAR